jgi:N utilization substance protein A
VRLASKISGWSLDVISESEYNKKLKDTYNSLLSLEGVGEATAMSLYHEGFRSISDLAGSAVEDITQVKGIDAEKAMKIIESAKKQIEEGNSEVKPAQEETRADEG